jgi:uncharacterized membrane protein
MSAERAAPPTLISFPLAVLAASVPWDLAALVSGSAHCRSVAYWTLVTGIVGAIVAAAPDFIDWHGLPRGTRVRAIGLARLVLNFVVAGLFGVSLLARSTAPGGYLAADFWQMGWGWLGVMLAVVGRWLGSDFIETSVEWRPSVGPPTIGGGGVWHRRSEPSRRLPVATATSPRRRSATIEP